MRRLIALSGTINKRWVYAINFGCFVLLLTLVFTRPEAPKYWDFYPDSHDYLEQSKNSFFSLDLYAPQRSGRLARAFTVPLFYKLTGSDFENFILFQSIFYCLSVLLFVSTIASFIKRAWLQFLFVPLFYFFFSWWNIVGWTNQAISEHLSFCFLLVWIAVLVRFLSRRSFRSFILLLVVTILHSFTRDTWPYLIVLTCVFLFFIYFRTERRFALRYLLTYLAFSVILFFVQQKTVERGERYRLSMYNNILARVAQNKEHLDWFAEHGLPLAPILWERFGNLNVMVKDDEIKLYYTYGDSTYAPIFNWITNGGKSTYMKFLVTHPSYFFLLDETKPERDRVFCYNLDGYIGAAPGYYKIPCAVFPLFNIWFVLALCLLLVWLSVKSKTVNMSYVLPLLLVLLTIVNVFLSYNAEALEVERHMYYTSILIDIIGWISLFVVIEFLIDKYGWRFRKYAGLAPAVAGSGSLTETEFAGSNPESAVEKGLTTKLKLRIDWSEMDLFGHVNNVAFMKYVQAGRVNFWEEIGLTKMHNETKQGPVLAATKCNFIRPLHYPGDITVETSVEFLKTTSFGLHHKIFNDANEIAAEAHDVVVMFDFTLNQKMEIPAGLRKTMEHSS